MVYTPAFADAPTARRWFESLRDAVTWRSERRRMYDRDVDVPRLVAGYRLSDRELPPVLTEASQRAAGVTGTPFNSVGLNFYRSGQDSVAPHNDHLYEIVAGYPIALISLGATRLMTIRSKTKPRRIFDLDLEEGSLLLMSFETQKHYDHGIPKTRAAVGPRISVALRVRP
ncbi:MAG: alpha-ketoglutarate-dependent dioxygenase AlkB [Candidatus Cybelea sp.]